MTPNKTQGSECKLSVVIPVCNEQDNVPPLYESICEVLDGISVQFELVFVDDGSHDKTLENLEQLVSRDPRVVVIKLGGNVGQTAALHAGTQHARGDVIVTLDGDLQNDPRDIPRLLEKIDQGYDLVTGWRKDRKDAFATRTLPSRLANWLIAKTTGIPIHDTGCSLKAYRAELIKHLPLYSEMHRLIPALSTLATIRFAEVVVRHHPRRFGKSHYGLGRIVSVILDVIAVKMLIAFSQRPSHWFGGWSIPFFIISALTGAYSVTMALGPWKQTNLVTWDISFLFAFLAIHLLLCGIFGDLVVSLQPSRRVRSLREYVNITARPSD